MKMIVTGATGFVGRAILKLAIGSGHTVRALVRGGHGLSPQVEAVEVGDLLTAQISASAFEGCDVLINCAARVHVTRETATDPQVAYRAMNSDLPVRLLELAAASGIVRFVQLSSVAAVMSQTPTGVQVDDAVEPMPETPYGRSKLEADLRLQQRARDLRHISVVSLRPPAVFGPGVAAYFQMLMRSARLGVPLPIGAIENRRSFIFLYNLADAVISAAASKREGAFIVTDSPPVSTAELYRKLLQLYSRPAIVPRLAAPLVRRLASLALGQRTESLIGDAAFDGRRFCDTFSWAPRFSADEALAMTVRET